MYRLYAYAADSDLASIEQRLVGDFEIFAGRWGVAPIRLRNKKAPLIAGQALPDWNIGFSSETRELSTGQLVELVAFLSTLAKKYDRGFVVGTWDRKTSDTTDFCVIKPSSSEVDVNALLEHLQASE